MGSPRARFGSVVRGGRIYVVGGKRGFRKKDQLRNIEVFDPKTNRDEKMQCHSTQGCQMAKFDCALHPGAIQGKEGIQFCSVA